MSKVQKSLRIEEADAERVRALKGDGETEAAAYARVIRAGLEALEAPEEDAQESEEEPAGPAGTGAGEPGLVDALRAQLDDRDARIALLQAGADTDRELVDVLKSQLAEKDAQIMRLQSALDAQAAALAAEAVGRMKRPRGIIGRVRALLSGGTEEGETNGRD